MDIPYIVVNGRKVLSIDGIRLLRRSAGLPDLKSVMEFQDIKEWYRYLRSARKETLSACFLEMVDGERE